jgi:hypothetical protein
MDNRTGHPGYRPRGIIQDVIDAEAEIITDMVAKAIEQQPSTRINHVLYMMQPSLAVAKATRSKLRELGFDKWLSQE